VLLAQFFGLALLVLFLPVLEHTLPAHDDVIWGAAAGVAGSIGVALLYRGLAVGTMAIVAPITAVCAVAIPVVAALLLGERPGAETLAGILLAAIAIVLVSQQAPHPGDAHVSREGIGLAVMSGIAIGGFFLLLARTSPTAGVWPLVAARSTSVILFAAVAALRRTPLRMPRPILGMLAIGGGLDMLANLLYIIATHHGPLSVIVTLSSLYPASTVLLARAVLGERLSAVQGLGVGCALFAVLLIVGS
jgi:uncharacterized membrane protein